MGTFIYLVVSLLLAGFSLYVLYTGKYPFLRILCWIAFYLSASAIAMLWLNFFFPEMSYEGTVIGFHSALVSWGKICLGFSVGAGFFLWVYLMYKNSEISLEKIAKRISGSITVFLLIAIILISAVAFWTRSYQESKLVTANITKADIFPDKLVTESITIDDLFPKVGPNVIIPEGSSLCGSLGITKQYALQFAKINHLKYCYHGNKLIVLVHQGDEFMPVGKLLWTPVKKEKR